jgi:hypothetical protein
MRWPWSRREDRAQDLLKTFLDVEGKRLEATALLEGKRGELELAKLKIEVENADTLQKARAEDMKLRAEIRQGQRERAAQAREKRAEKQKAAAAAAANPQGQQGECRVCRNQSDASLTMQEIAWHHSGHRAMIDLFSS